MHQCTFIFRFLFKLFIKKEQKEKTFILMSLMAERNYAEDEL